MEQNRSTQQRNLLLKLRQAYTLSKRKVDAILKDTGITSAQYMFLQYLYEHQDAKLTQNDLAREFMVQHTSIIETVKRLKERGLIQVQPERNTRLLSLTDQGINLLESIADQTDDMFRQEFSDVEGDLFHVLQILLTRYINTISDK